MGDPATRPKMTIEEYLAFEEAADEPHEFINGEAYAMSGGTAEHAAIAANIIGALIARLRGRRCRPTTSDQRIFVPATEAFFYPDVSVICGGYQYADRDHNGIVNPKVIFEVLPPSTTDEVTEGDLALPALGIEIPLDEIYDLADVRPG